MMDRMVAVCGLICSECEAYVATQAGDSAALQTVVDKWRIEYNFPEMTVAGVMCDGCVSSSTRLCAHCFECEIRACGQQHGVANCGLCAEFTTCTRIEGFMAMVPPARETLTAINRQA